MSLKNVSRWEGIGTLTCLHPPSPAYQAAGQRLPGWEAHHLGQLYHQQGKWPS